MANQKRRAHKVSKGERRSSRSVPLTQVQRALLGKGLVARFASIGSVVHPK